MLDVQTMRPTDYENLMRGKVRLRKAVTRKSRQVMRKRR